MPDTLLLYNGHIVTMDRSNPHATSVAMRDGTVIAVGSDNDVRQAAGPNFESIDLQGRTATPGLNDAHAHPIGVGFGLTDLNLATPPNQRVTDIVSLVATATRDRSPDRWIVGRGYDQARLEDQRHPTRRDLDPVAPNHPVLLLRACHHIGVANSAALLRAGITAGTPDPDGGSIDRDDHGEPTGLLRESALEQLRSVMPEPSEDDYATAVERAGHTFLAHGVTSVAEAVVSSPRQVAAYQSLWQRGRLPVRTSLMLTYDEMLEPAATIGFRTGFGDDRLKLGPIKLFSDGSIGGRTARMRHPYESDADNVGLWMMEPDELKQKILRAHQLGFQLAIHAIGDAAIDLVLDGYETAQQASPRDDARHRIEHCSIVDDGILARIAALGVIPIPGTSFLYYFRDAYLQNLGEDRSRHAYGLVSFARHGITAAASTDAPVVSPRATIGLQTMITRRDETGHAVGLEEAVSLDDALRAYTANGAYATFDEHRKGMLAPGLLGDVTVFETNIHDLEPEHLGQVNVDFTITDGLVVYERH